MTKTEEIKAFQDFIKMIQALPRKERRRIAKENKKVMLSGTNKPIVKK